MLQVPPNGDDRMNLRNHTKMITKNTKEKMTCTSTQCRIGTYMSLSIQRKNEMAIYYAKLSLSIIILLLVL